MSPRAAQTGGVDYFTNGKCVGSGETCLSPYPLCAAPELSGLKQVT